MRRARRSTLFPYTTLFRSERVSEEALGQEALSFFAGGRLLRTYRIGDLVSDPGRLPRSVSHFMWQERERRDRKSTRLNSSHRCISYAVFCLKKKKRNGIMV